MVAARVGVFDGGEHRRGARRQHRGDGAGVQQGGALQHKGEAVRQAGKLPGEVERVGGGAVVVNQGGGHAGGQLVGALRQHHGAGAQVRGHGIPVGVAAVAADELHGMVQAGQAHRDIEGAAAHVGFDSGGALDNVNKALANNSEHGHTLPEKRPPTQACYASPTMEI